MAWYRPVAVAPELRDALVCGWTAQVDGVELLVPDGCVDVMWLADGRVVVCGPETSAWPVVVPKGTDAVGVRFRPGVAPGLLGTPAHLLLDTRVGLDDVLGRGARALAREVTDAGSAEARLDLLTAAAQGWLYDHDGPDPLALWTVRVLSRRSSSIAELADGAGLTDRQLQRRSRAAFGYPPSMLRVILRLQRFMALARAPGNAHLGLAELAHLAGYSDQAHLSHDCRRIASSTPSELLQSQVPDWHGPGSVVDDAPVPAGQAA
ncbi:helix-turn-helix domain-containing protein [Jiangella sp. DSM 45060]|uniref:helix-turn-helix domain-containing protein n=1 Tax=Jiangella sp. DSM 45060 TaxID=1798224 RepID=UPI0008793A3F|nr:helix-turn-helix domain-containing protein [Jiangella sp. DSM 45060]SDT70024.1 Helix-turn-helix domain-containing protein [Jiangella sp. DSM 45060]